jgi:hypothetical protein
VKRRRTDQAVPPFGVLSTSAPLPDGAARPSHTVAVGHESSPTLATNGGSAWCDHAAPPFCVLRTTPPVGAWFASAKHTFVEGHEMLAT